MKETVVDIGVRYYGTVSYAPNHQACYVRMSISQPDGIPLCIKATFVDFNRKRLKKGTVVSVERTTQHDARRYKVIQIFDEGDSDMATSKDRVRFFLPPKYFSDNSRLSASTMGRSTCKRILLQAFGMDNGESERMIQNHSDGFTILCRPSQFARFIVYRHDANECINGIKDLRPEIVPKMDVYDKVARVLLPESK